MSQVNHDIFDEYKSVDRICKDIYNSDKGVTTYIDNMSEVSQWESMIIPQWEETLFALKRIRKLRNEMAHEEGAFEYADGTQGDLDWLKQFHNSLLNQTDPLCMFYQKNKEQQEALKKKNISTSTKANENIIDETDSNQVDIGVGVLVVVLVFAIMTAALIIGVVMIIAGLITIPWFQL